MATDKDYLLAVLRQLRAAFLDPPLTSCPRCGAPLKELPHQDDANNVNQGNVDLLVMCVILVVVLAAVVWMAHEGKLAYEPAK